VIVIVFRHGRVFSYSGAHGRTRHATNLRFFKEFPKRAARRLRSGVPEKPMCRQILSGTAVPRPFILLYMLFQSLTPPSPARTARLVVVTDD
jgi:hypothetical protein